MSETEKREKESEGKKEDGAAGNCAKVCVALMDEVYGVGWYLLLGRRGEGTVTGSPRRIFSLLLSYADMRWDIPFCSCFFIPNSVLPRWQPFRTVTIHPFIYLSI